MHRVGIVTTWFERGAAYVSRAYRDVLEPCFDVKIFARGGEAQAQGDPNWDGPEVTWSRPIIHRKSGIERVDRRQFREWIVSNDLHCVLFNEEHDWQLVVDAKRLGKVVGSYIDYYTPETVELFSVYDFLLCNTNRHYSVFSWHPGCYYIPWGTDCEVFQYAEASEQRTKLTFFHSAGMGGVNLRKGTDLAAKAFAKLQGNAELIIHSQVGTEAYGEVAGLIQEHPDIRFINCTTPAPGLYHLGDVYVYPGRLDGIGLSIPEALASGLPAIVPNTGPYTDFITHNDNGWLIPIAASKSRKDCYYWPEVECDLDALVSQMQWIVDHSDQVPEYRRRARESAKAHLSWRTNAAGLPQVVDRFCRLSELRCSPSNRARLGEQIFRFRPRSISERLTRRIRKLLHSKSG